MLEYAIYKWIIYPLTIKPIVTFIKYLSICIKDFNEEQAHREYVRRLLEYEAKEKARKGRNEH